MALSGGRKRKPELVSFLSHRECGIQKRCRPGQRDIALLLAEEKATLPISNQSCELSGQCRATFLMAFSPDGLKKPDRPKKTDRAKKPDTKPRCKMASTHGDHTVRVTDIKTGKCTHILHGHPRTPWCLAFHPSANGILASGCLAGEVRIWDLQGGGSEVWKSDTGAVAGSIAFHPTDQVLVIAAGSEILFWDWTRPKPFARTQTANKEQVRWVKFDPWGHHLYTGIANTPPQQPDAQLENNAVSYISDASPTLPVEDRSNLQQRYRHIVEQITTNQTARINTLYPPGNGVTSSEPPALPVASTNQLAGMTFSGPHEADFEIIEPRSPLHVEAEELESEYAQQNLANARQYAADVTSASLAMTSHQDVEREVVRVRNEHAEENFVEHTENPLPTQSHSLLQDILEQDTDMPPRRTRDDVSQFLFEVDPLLMMSSEERESSRHGSLNSLASESVISRISAVPSLTPFSRESSTIELGPINRRLPLIGLSRSEASTSVAVTSSGALHGVGISSSPPTSGSVTPSLSAGQNSVSLDDSSVGAVSSEARSRSSDVTASTASSLDSQISILRARLSNCRSATALTTSCTTQVTVTTTATVISSAGAHTMASRTNTARSSLLRSHLLSQPPPLLTSIPPSMSASQSNSTTVSYSHDHSPGQCNVCGNVGLFAPVTGSNSSDTSRQPATSLPSRSNTAGTQDGEVGREVSAPSAAQRVAAFIGSEVEQTLNRVSNNPVNIQDCLANISMLQTHTGATPSSQPGPRRHRLLPPSLTENRQAADFEQTQIIRNALGLTTLPSTPELTGLPPLSYSSSMHRTSTLSHSSHTDITSTGLSGAYTPQPSISPFSTRTNSSYILPRQDSALHMTTQPQSTSVASTPAEWSGRYRSVMSILAAAHAQRSSATATTSSTIRQTTATPDVRRSHLIGLGRDSASGSNRQSSRQCAMLQARLRDRHARLRPGYQSIRQQILQRAEALSSSNPPAPVAGIPDPSRVRGADLLDLRPVAGPSRVVGRQGRHSAALSHHHGYQSRSRAGRHDAAWVRLQRRHLHPHYSVSILDDTINRQSDILQAAINRAIASAFMGVGESAVASNIVNVTHRIQRWDFSKAAVPNLPDVNHNVVVTPCKLHNDASCEISQNGEILAAFVPSHRGFPDDTILGIFSLQTHSLGQCLYTKSFGPNAISVSISPLNNYVLVGLAAKRLAWVFTPKQMVAQIYKLNKQQAGEDSMEPICDLMHPCELDIRTHISVNSARWLPGVGEGVVYGTNKGDLHICRPGDDEKDIKDGRGGNGGEGNESSHIRRNLMQMLGISLPSTMSTSTQTHRVRRSASTQTDHHRE